MNEELKICPFCNNKLELKTRLTKEIIKNIEIEYIENYLFCDNDEEELYDEELSKENYINLTDRYKEFNNLLTSKQIKMIRQKYSLAQSDLAILLGMGQITVTRYETGIIQEKTHDFLLRTVDNDPHFLIDLLSYSTLPQKKKNKIKESIISCVENKDIMIDNILGYDYYTINEKYCGENSFNKEKVFNCFKVLLDKNIQLTKTKAAKILFYIDFLMYKKYSKSVTGIAYFKMPFGALPLSYDQIYKYSNLEVIIEQEGDIEKQIISKVKSNDCLTNEELEVVLLVANKFKDMKTKEIVDYMHEEVAYIDTENNKLIDYSYSKFLNKF